MQQLLNVQVPLIFKDIIDSLNVEMTAESTVYIVAGSLILGCTCSPQSASLLLFPRGLHKILLILLCQSHRRCCTYREHALR